MSETLPKGPEPININDAFKEGHKPRIVKLFGKGVIFGGGLEQQLTEEEIVELTTRVD